VTLLRPYEVFVKRCLFVTMVSQLFTVTLMSQMHIANRAFIEEMKADRQNVQRLEATISELQSQVEASTFEVVGMRVACEKHENQTQ